MEEHDLTINDFEVGRVVTNAEYGKGVILEVHERNVVVQFYGLSSTLTFQDFEFCELNLVNEDGITYLYNKIESLEQQVASLKAYIDLLILDTIDSSLNEVVKGNIE